MQSFRLKKYVDKNRKSNAKNIESVRKYREKAKSDPQSKIRITKLTNRSKRRFYNKTSCINNPKLALQRYRRIGRKLLESNLISEILHELSVETPKGYDCNLDEWIHKYRGKIETEENDYLHKTVELFSEFVRLHLEYDFVTLDDESKDIIVTAFKKICVLSLPTTKNAVERAFVVRKRKLYHFDFRKVLPDDNLPISIEYTKRCDPEQYQSIALERWLVPYGYNIDSMRDDFVESDGMEG